MALCSSQLKDAIDARAFDRRRPCAFRDCGHARSPCEIETRFAGTLHSQCCPAKEQSKETLQLDSVSDVAPDEEHTAPSERNTSDETPCRNWAHLRVAGDSPHGLIMAQAPDRTAFVFTGGGSAAAAEVGMLTALVEHGVQPHLVIGASAGAINAVHFAADPTLSGVDRLANLWRALASSRVFPRSRSHELLALFGLRPSLIDPTALEMTLAQHLPVERLEHTTLPCHVVATDFSTGEEVVLSTGPALDALLASCAIPVLFPPREIGGRLLVDGGIASNAPIGAAIARGATRIIVLPTGFPCAVRSVPRDLSSTLVHTFALLVARQLVHEIPGSKGVVRLRIVPPLCPMPVAAYDFSHAAELIAGATVQTREWLDADGLEEDDIPPTLTAHSHRDTDMHADDAWSSQRSML